MAVSLDGVMVPMKEGDAEGKELGGPRGYQEVGCGTVSFYDAEGNRLLSRRRHVMPEVIAFEDFVAHRGEQGAKQARKWRLEGDDYRSRRGTSCIFD